MKNLGLTLLILFSSLRILYSQQVNTSQKQVYETKDIIFYGYDFTHFKLADAKRMDEDIKKFIFVWIGFCQEQISPKKLPTKLYKDKVVFNFEPTLLLNKKLNSIDMGTISTHTISKDSIQSYISKYNLSEKEGVGFVVIIECFDNANKKVSGYFTFFDISSKQILKIDYISSKDGNSYNRVSDWGVALVIAFKRYLKLYKENRKAFSESEK